MNRTYEKRKTAQHYEADNDASNNFDYESMTKDERKKAKFIQKEQTNRQKLMQNDGLNFPSISYPVDRFPSISAQSTGTETDLNELEWTPQDSSYGAAFPFCGWIPKSLRQAIEKLMIALVGFLVIYSIVSIAILLTGDRENKKRKSSTYKYDDFYFFDDNFYVKDYMDDADDYLNVNNGSNAVVDDGNYAVDDVNNIVDDANNVVNDGY